MTMPATVREARSQDAAGIADLWNHFIRETAATFNSEEKSAAEVEVSIAARSAEGRGFFVGVGEAGEVLGFATYFQFRGGVGYARTAEHTVLLDPGAHGRGLGRALMARIEDHARQSGHHMLFAGVSSGNPDGLAFHARLGFEEVAVLREVGWKWGRWFDLHLMQKRIGP